MSKRLSSGQANTLLNYFHSPKGKLKAGSSVSESKPNLDVEEETNAMKSMDKSQEDIDESCNKPSVSSISKKRRIPIICSDSDSDQSSVNGGSKVKFKKAKFTSRSSNGSSSDESENKTVHSQESIAERLAKFKYKEHLDASGDSTLNGDEGKTKSTKIVPVKSFSSEKSSNDSNKENIEGQDKVVGKASCSTSIQNSPPAKLPKFKVKKRCIVASHDSSSDSDEEKVLKKSFASEKFNSDLNKENIKDQDELVSKPSCSTSIQNIPLSSDGNWLHNKLQFLKPENIRDINKNRPDHPNYDKNTLFVPEDFLNKQTPAMRQWWILKSKHFDCVLFFKVGKFYEFYHMDAVIGVNNLGFSYMKGEFAHSGFPESAYGKMASSLVEQGFKVARVEQTETPDMMAERCKALKKAGKFDKVVKREICQITTNATCVYGAQLTDAKEALPCYMLAIAEKPLSCGSRFGVCFVDTSIGTFNLGEFNDDPYYSRILALLAEHPTGLVLSERGRMQKSTTELLKKTLLNIHRDTLAPNTQFYSAQNTLDLLAKGCYFRDNNNEFNWPAGLKDLIEDGCPKKEYELALKALGACLWYLQDSELDIYVFSMKKFELYLPVDVTTDKESFKRNFMVLDSMTMEHLNLLGSTGTLQKTLDYCETAFGKRLLQHWICRPLCVQHHILERQKAVQELYLKDGVRQAARSILKRLPDFERQVLKIHTFGNKYCATQHPDGRAVLYENKIYSKRKIMDLISTLEGFDAAQELVRVFADCDSRLLKKLTQRPPQGTFIDLSNSLQFFRQAFNQNQAAKDGNIIPRKSVDVEYDEVQRAIEDLQEKLQMYLEEQEKIFGCKLSYHGTDKKRYQIEVPEAKTHKATSSYQLESTKRGSKPTKRYSTPATRQFLVEMLRIEGKRNKIVQDLNRRIFEMFTERRDEWEQCIQCLMVLDVICAFAEYARASSYTMCFPTIMPYQNESYVTIEDSVHPCTLLEDFVPNSTTLGGENEAKIMLLTGPNMGGKSTLMRQVAVIIIMAQMGCPVPAAKCEISLVDRIFTRLGAHDDILRGQSTFLVELYEASAILRHATRHSFVLLDELGRGTSTHDGNAIATAYVHKLTEIQCRTMFSTHYHSLVEKFANRNDVQLAHMACMIDDEQEQEGDAALSVTLLYQLRKGSCPKSYGFNAAKLAGLPTSIVKRAHEVATYLENVAITRRLVRNLLQSNDATYIRDTLSNMRIE